MITEGQDPHLAEKLQEELNQSVNATIKVLMVELERLASLPPEEACEPVLFNRTRHALIRRLWNLAKECIRYGAISVQRDEYRQ